MSYQPIDIIKNAIKNNKLAHAYLFYGDKGVDVESQTVEAIKIIIELSGKKADFTNLENANYFDLQIITPSKEKDNQIIKEDVDLAISKLFETSLEKNSMKILYIKDVDAGNKTSLNRLLKFIEEPVNNLIIFMNTNHFENVISTIRSRSQNIFVKRDGIKDKIKKIESITKNEQALLANIFSSTDQIKSIDTDLFHQTYLGTIEALEEAKNNKFAFKEKMFSLWNKNNNDFILSILQFFIYQLMIEIDSEIPLFPKQNDLIMKYKIKNLDCFKIQMLIGETKNNIKNHGNFSLQKINFLNLFEKELK